MVEDADEKLFNNIIYNKLNVLNHIVPDTKDTKYHLRPRTHNLMLTVPFLKAIYNKDAV